MLHCTPSPARVPILITTALILLLSAKNATQAYPLLCLLDVRSKPKVCIPFPGIKAHKARFHSFAGCCATPRAEGMQESNLQTKKKVYKLSEKQRQALVGCLLGDGHLSPGRIKGVKQRFSLTILQSQAHKKYVFHMYEIFKDLIFKDFSTTPPKQYDFKDKRSPGKTYTRWYFSTTQQSCLRWYGLQFYKNRKKKIPKLIKKLLTPRPLAYWYMDDGAAKWQGKSLGLRFCTDNFTLDECKQLIIALQDKYGLQCTLQRKGKQFRIYVKHNCYHIIKGLIFKHLIPEMRYKFPREY